MSIYNAHMSSRRRSYHHVDSSTSVPTVHFTNPFNAADDDIEEELLSRKSQDTVTDKYDSYARRPSEVQTVYFRVKRHAKNPLHISLIVNLILVIALLLQIFRQPPSRSTSLFQGRESVKKTVEYPYSPVAEHIEYETRDLWRWTDADKFMGPGRAEVDQAWRDLLAGSLFRITDAEMAAANTTSIPLRDGGYAGGLGVSHNLHCIKRIKQAMNIDYYYPDRTPDVEQQVLHHADHCLEALRQASMCTPDFSLYTLQWVPDWTQDRPVVKYEKQTTCVNWDKMHDWMKSRAVRQQDLMHDSSVEPLWERIERQKLAEAKANGHRSTV